jgi:putative tryptophan/tyrosine transport system substrate-binding protein
VRRREFLTGVAAAAAARSSAAAQPASPTIGFLHSGSPEQNVARLGAFLKGLRDAGFVDGRNVRIEYRWAMGDSDALPGLAADLVRRNVALIATPGSTAAAVVAKSASPAIPVVFSVGTDPVALGLVASLTRPGGNATGVTSLNAEVAAKRLSIARELVPNASRYFTLVKPTSELAAPFVKDLRNAAVNLGIELHVLNANTVAEIEDAFASIRDWFERHWIMMCAQSAPARLCNEAGGRDLSRPSRADVGDSVPSLVRSRTARF